MFYVTYPVSARNTNVAQIDVYDQLYSAGVDMTALTAPPPIRTEILRTRTIQVAEMQIDAVKADTINTAIRCTLATRAFAAPAIEYDTFQIPKSSGGYRTIHAPIEALKRQQRAVVDTLRDSLHMWEHDCAYAYIPGRSTVHALQQHTANQSKWYLKIDLKNFFPSCTTELVQTQLAKLYPLATLPMETITELLSICFHDFGDGVAALPQGAPSSPMLSNLMMVPTDYAIVKALKQANERFVYTRYADDLLISSPFAFDKNAIVQLVADLLPQPLKINHDKIRYGSAAGRNWNLGLMVNQHNDITVGHKEKERMRAALHSLLTNPESWPLQDRQVFQGKFAYLRYIEPTYADTMLRRYEQKCGRTLRQVLQV